MKRNAILLTLMLVFALAFTALIATTESPPNQVVDTQQTICPLQVVTVSPISAETMNFCLLDNGIYQSDPLTVITSDPQSFVDNSGNRFLWVLTKNKAVIVMSGNNESNSGFSLLDNDLDARLTCYLGFSLPFS